MHLETKQRHCHVLRSISASFFQLKQLRLTSKPCLFTFLKNNDILDRFQSGFRAQYSTESALLKVLNDLLLAVDSGKCVVLVLLDLSAAFDTIDHTILPKHLEQYVGIRGMALNRFASYLEGRTFSVEIYNITSSCCMYMWCPTGIRFRPSFVFSFHWLISFVSTRLRIIVMQMTYIFISLLSLMRIHLSSHY